MSTERKDGQTDSSQEHASAQLPEPSTTPATIFIGSIHDASLTYG
eukprot:CAMPEP_0172880884 /NCGR_PEP_ID=MMETSP1075-20121228/116113_1 /TAXON_ID=2916 /ORGANISM="Ceratium fusus, Strain PA161109" /LENGTH=44 /DNA_ID= /DNA_START= /DNA_END= /DNA_ORIENTATION=